MEYKYGKPQKYFYANEDPSLTPIRIDIDKVIEKNYKFWNQDAKECPILKPPPEKIANYGLPPKEQYFRRRETPKKLRDLEKQMDGRPDDIWRILISHKENYAEEIQFIREEWFFTTYGYWVYINGIPTWIPPTHYEYLTYCTGNYVAINPITKKKESSLYPSYRDVDRRIDITFLYLFTCTETFEKLDKKGVAIPEEDGSYKMKDVGRFLFFGWINPKNRRRGETSKALSKIFGKAKKLAGPQGHSSINANSESTAKNHWNTKFVPMVRKYPFFFKPISDGSNRPKTEYSFKAPGAKEVGKNFNRSVSTETIELDSKIDFSPVVSLGFYDHAKITGDILCDEKAKIELKLQLDVYEEWSRLKPTMAQGAEAERNRYAFSHWPSTVEEMENGTGVPYQKLCNASNFYQRGELSGQTKSGLCMIYFPTEDGLENFIGMYGESIIGDPTPEQAEFTGWTIGSREYLKSKVEEFEKDPTVDNLRKLAQFKRQNPPTYADIWRGGSGDIGFDIKKLDNHIDYWNRQFSLGNDPRKRGEFVWVVPGQGTYTAAEFLKNRLDDYDIPGAYVDFRENPGGHWLVSKILSPEQANRRVKCQDVSSVIYDHYEPIDDIYTMGGDPNDYHNASQMQKREDKSGASNYCSAIYYPFDDEERDKPIMECESGKFIASFCAKIDSVDECNEMMLMACVWFGVRVNHERNKNQIEPYFIKRGFGGYLHYAWLPEKGKFRNSSGYHLGAEEPMDNLISAIREHISYYMHDPHIEIYEEYRKFNSKDDLTKLDLASGSAGALTMVKQKPLNKGTKRMPKDGVVEEDEGFSYEDIYGRRR